MRQKTVRSHKMGLVTSVRERGNDSSSGLLRYKVEVLTAGFWGHQMRQNIVKFCRMGFSDISARALEQQLLWFVVIQGGIFKDRFVGHEMRQNTMKF